MARLARQMSIRGFSLPLYEPWAKYGELVLLIVLKYWQMETSIQSYIQGRSYYTTATGNRQVARIRQLQKTVVSYSQVLWHILIPKNKLQNIYYCDCTVVNIYWRGGALWRPSVCRKCSLFRGSNLDTRRPAVIPSIHPFPLHGMPRLLHGRGVYQDYHDPAEYYGRLLNI